MIISGAKSHWRPVSGGIPQESVLGLMLSNIFLNLDGVMEQSVPSVSLLMTQNWDSCTAIWRDLNKLRNELAGTSCHSARGSTKSCSWGGTMHQYKLGADQLESAFAD